MRRFLNRPFKSFPSDGQVAGRDGSKAQFNILTLFHFKIPSHCVFSLPSTGE